MLSVPRLMLEHPKRLLRPLTQVHPLLLLAVVFVAQWFGHGIDEAVSQVLEGQGCGPEALAPALGNGPLLCLGIRLLLHNYGMHC